MDSCIYEGRVSHTRSSPALHRFEYRIFMLYLDLSELPELFEKRWLWSASRPAVARFRRERHLGRVPYRSTRPSVTILRARPGDDRPDRFVC